MNEHKIKQMSVEELVVLRTLIDEQIVIKQKEQKKALVSEFKSMAAKLGLSLEDVMSLETAKVRKSSGQKVAPKFRHPKNVEFTWTGRGRKPLWVEEYLAKGGRLEDLAI